MSKKYNFVLCDSCNAKNDVNLALKNDDYDRDEVRKDTIYVYCQECGSCIEINLK